LVKISYPRRTSELQTSKIIYIAIGINSIRNIPIKVETEDGKQGWLVWLNGGD